MQKIKIGVQSFGRFLSSMIMPNIGAFIAWGLITALFIPTGWLPNATLASLGGPMVTYLLPLLIGYTGGSMIHGTRGGVVGAITTMGVIVGASIPMFLGAMIVGPFGGWVIKKVDSLIGDKIKTGFEMLINNFSIGIIGMLLALLAFVVIGPVVSYFNILLGAGVKFLVSNNLLVLSSIIVEPAKLLFLNNAINHGVLSPLGLEESARLGKSIFFLLESNPGPGLGVLLAYMFFEKQKALKQSAAGAGIIHFFGGIHEIYFPYVLMRPILIIALIISGMSGVFVLNMLNAGLVSTPSPGSILAILALTPKGDFLKIIIGVAVPTVVSFIISAFLIKLTNTNKSLEDAKSEKESLKNKPIAFNSNDTNFINNIKHITFACDAGMGSSAMGASLFKNKLKEANINISVVNKAINDLITEDTFIITHQTLTERARNHLPNAYHISLSNFMDAKFYDALILKIKNAIEKDTTAKPLGNKQTKLENQNNDSDSNILLAKNIKLGLPSTKKEEAIRLAGELLYQGGYVDKEYIDSMLIREKITSTFIGNNTAIPHGTNEAKDTIISSGIVVLQYPDGVDFDGNIANLVIGIAGKNNTHIDILSQLALALGDEEKVKILINTLDKKVFLESFQIITENGVK